MTANHTDTVEIIARTLLHVAYRVVEVYRDHIITRIWDKNDSIPLIAPAELIGRNIGDARNDTVFKKCGELAAIVFATGQDQLLEYTNVYNNKSVTFSIRVLNCHPDKDYLLITVEALAQTKHPEIIEDKWRLALEAAGDGIWDIHIESDLIFFSPKWHDIFGYVPGEIITREDWTSKVHPDDLETVNRQLELYASGAAPIYSCEIRYLCKDGTYKWILSRGVVATRDENGKPLRFIGTHQDINERKLIEEKYQGNLNLVLNLINSLPSGILVTDQYRQLVFANQAFCDIFEIPMAAAELSGLNGDERLQKNKLFYKDQQYFLSRTEELMRNKTMALNEEFDMVDGRVLSRDYIPLTFNENYRGEIWRFTDITSQKDIDNRFERQRLFYEHLLTSIPTNINAIDTAGRFLYINPNSLNDTPTREWAIGKTIVELHKRLGSPAEKVAVWLNYFNSALQEQRKVEWVDKVELPDGGVAYLLRCFLPIIKVDGQVDMMIAYGVSITDRILAEEALKSSMDAFAHSFNYSGIGKALLAPGGKWLEVNDIICKLTGYTREELQGMHYHEITFPDDVYIDVPYIQQLLNKEVESYTIEKRYVSKTRQIIVTSLTVSLLWNADGTPKYFICDIIDITSQKLLTEELHRQNAELEAVQTNLINKISQLEELSHMIAHNLRWPAGNIKMLTELLLLSEDELAATNKGFTRAEALSILNKSGIALASSLNTLIELSEIKLNKKIAYNKCDFAEVIGNITRQLESTIFQKNASIQLELEVKEVSYPKIYLESILYNLISNALKFSINGVQPVITINTRQGEKRVLLTVKDNGLGIDLKKHGDKVFKLNKIFHEGFDSKGVGLFLTRSQIESLGGNISVVSKPKKGAEFTVVL